MKYLLVFIALFASCLHTWSQTDSLVNQGNLNAVEVFSDAYSFMGTYDSLLHERNVSSNLGQLLQQTGVAQVLNYGAQGALVTARINGAASDHTTVSWNGLNINSPTLGLSDLSLLPSFFFDDPQLRLYATRQVGQGGLAANLGLRAPHSANSGVKIAGGVNSMMNSYVAMKAGFQGEQLFVDARFLKESNRNEFEYKDRLTRGEPLNTQENNNAIQDAASMTLGWTAKKVPLRLKMYSWWQHRRMNLSNPMGVSNNQRGAQQDSIFRFGGEVGWNNGQWVAAFVSSREFQNYSLRIPSLNLSLISSDYNVANSMASIANRSRWRKWSSFLEARYNKVDVRNSNYERGVVAEDIIAFNGAVRSDIAEDIFIEFFAYHELRQNFKTEPSFGVIFSTKDRKPQNLLPGLTLSLSRKFRVPDFNERFWIPGGNAQLLPENGYQGQLLMQWTLLDKESWSGQLAWENVAQQIDNWIQWVPEGVWTPKNYRIVRSFSSNIMLDLGWKWKRSKVMLTSRWRWNRTSAVNNRVWRAQDQFELAYTPLITGTIGLDFVRERWDVGVLYRFMDVRLDRDRLSIGTSRVLPSYGVCDVFFGAKYRSSSLRLRCENAMDIRFENIWGYPMPGRVWHIQWIQNFNFNKK